MPRLCTPEERDKSRQFLDVPQPYTGIGPASTFGILVPEGVKTPALKSHDHPTYQEIRSRLQPRLSAARCNYLDLENGGQPAFHTVSGTVLRRLLRLGQTRDQAGKFHREGKDDG